MRKVLVFLCFAICSQPVFSQNRPAVELSSEWIKRDYACSVTNHDYCDYLVLVNLSRVSGYQIPQAIADYTVHPGMVQLFVLKPNGMGLASVSTTYHFFRGDVSKTVIPDYPYILPVKSGDSVRIVPQQNSNYTLRINLQYASDTIYASRRGVVCNDDLYDTSAKGRYRKGNQITIYHIDGSFAEYSRFDKPLVYPGNFVEAGAPIALVFDKQGGRKEVSFSVYFLDNNKVRNNEVGSKHSHLVPVFHTANAGNTKLQERKTYLCEVTDELVTKEMSKREVKRYFKKKGK